MRSPERRIRSRHRCFTTSEISPATSSSHQCRHEIDGSGQRRSKREGSGLAYCHIRQIPPLPGESGGKRMAPAIAADFGRFAFMDIKWTALTIGQFFESRVIPTWRLPQFSTHRAMSIVESHWRQRQSRYEDGIYFATDDFIELCGSPNQGYRADLRAPIATLLRSTPDGWTHLDDLLALRRLPISRYLRVQLPGRERASSQSNDVPRAISCGYCTFPARSSSPDFVGRLGDSCDFEEYPFHSEWHIPIHSLREPCRIPNPYGN